MNTAIDRVKPVAWLLRSKCDGWKKVIEAPTRDDGYDCIPLYPATDVELLNALDEIATFCERRPLYGMPEAHSTVVAHMARAAIEGHKMNRVIDGRANDL